MRAALSFAGDLRYRNETFDVEHVDDNRNRDRVRARLNANFRVNDTVTGGIGIATGGPDPRSSNQTLTDQNSRKDFELDLAFVTWAPTADWRITAGKQRRVALAAQWWLCGDGRAHAARPCRFDAVLLDAPAAERITWLKGAFATD